LRNITEETLADSKQRDDILALTAQIVAAHAAHNAVPTSALPALIQEVHLTLVSIQRAPTEAPPRPEPAVPISKSVTQDYVICLEDGKKLKMLKRHLKASFNLTPDQYRQRWGLPADYPMVAPRYAKQRSSMAKQIGLGTANGKSRSASG
jgi:predicted transcriptional regulator